MYIPFFGAVALNFGPEIAGISKSSESGEIASGRISDAWSLWSTESDGPGCGSKWILWSKLGGGVKSSMSAVSKSSIGERISSSLWFWSALTN